jgi:hypothetical protein
MNTSFRRSFGTTWLVLLRISASTVAAYIQPKPLRILYHRGMTDPVSKRFANHRREILFALLGILGAGLPAGYVLSAASPGRIAVQCLEVMQRNERIVFRVAVTNTGASVVFPSSNQFVESGGGHVLFPLAGQLPMTRLRAGEGTVFELQLPNAGRGIFRGRWRMAFNYSDNEFRHWLHQPDGLGRLFQPLVPARFRGVALTVIGKSELYEPLTLEAPRR